MEVRFNDEKDSDGNGQTGFSDEGTLVGIGAEQNFGNGITGYVVGEFAFDILDESSAFDQDDGEFGLIGPFGEVAIGDVGSVASDAIYDPVDPFESASPSEADYTGSNSMITWFSPNMNGFELHLQTRFKDDTDQDTTDDNGDVTRDASSEVSLIAAATYSVGGFTVAAGYDDKGSEFLSDSSKDTKDPTYGVAATAELSDQLEVSVRYATEQDASTDANDTDFTAIGAVFDFGPGDLYATMQDVSPETGDSRTEMMFGGDYTLMGELSAYAEYAAFDKTNDEGDLTEVGLRFEF
jgi:predicted porin